MSTKYPSLQALRKIAIFCLALIIFQGTSTIGYGQLLRLMSKNRAASLMTAPPLPKLASVGGIAAAATAPVLDPLVEANSSGNRGAVLHLTGQNFDNDTRVFFGGVEASSISVLSTTAIDAVVGDGASGSVSVQNKKGAAQRTGFTFLPPPTISSVSPSTLSPGTVATIIGTSLNGATSVVIDGISATITAHTATALTVAVAGPVTKGITTVTTPDGIAIFPSLAAQAQTQAIADLSIPDPGQGFFVIPTPTFTYNQYHAVKNFGFSARIWGNSLGTDSSKLRAGNKLLLTQTSMLGFKTEGNLRLTNRTDTNVVLGLVGEVNFLLKKVSYFDTTSKSTTNFNPFVIHPRAGLLLGLFNDDVYVGAYFNFLCIMSENESFSNFYETGSKKVFVFPEFTMGGIFDLDKGSNQALRFELDLLVNNGDAKFIYNSKNILIPNLRIGFITRL